MRYKFLSSLVFLFVFSFSSNSLSDDSLEIAINNPLRGTENIQRDKYRNHKYYNDAVNFCEKWDQVSFDPNYKSMTLDDFAPMVKKIFSRKPYSSL